MTFNKKEFKNMMKDILSELVDKKFNEINSQLNEIKQSINNIQLVESSSQHIKTIQKDDDKKMFENYYNSKIGKQISGGKYATKKTTQVGTISEQEIINEVGLDGRSVLDDPNFLKMIGK